MKVLQSKKEGDVISPPLVFDIVAVVDQWRDNVS